MTDIKPRTVVLFIIGLAVLLVVATFYLTPEAPQAIVETVAVEVVVPVSIDGCPLLEASSSTLWGGQANSDSVLIRTGPGEQFPEHESGWLFNYDRVRVLQECRGWAQGSVMPPNLVGSVVAEYGRGRAIEMLTFWLPADQLRRVED